MILKRLLSYWGEPFVFLQYLTILFQVPVVGRKQMAVEFFNKSRLNKQMTSLKISLYGILKSVYSFRFLIHIFHSFLES